MRIIKRKQYLDQLVDVIGVPDIKVITGIRRSGKSLLLRQFAEQVRRTVADANIIQIDLSMPKNFPLHESEALYKAISRAYQKGRHNFLLVDEVQLCKGFEMLFTGLHAEMKYDIYITGSNAFLQSSDLATLFTGRTFAVQVFPFSLAEYMRYYDLKDPNTALEHYLFDGGMAGAYNYESLHAKYEYLKGVYQTLILRDVVQHNSLRHPQQLTDIGNYLMDNIGNLTSIRSITGVVSGSQSDMTSLSTNSNYVRYLCEAFVFYKIGRYDVKGKKLLAPPDKYYLADHALRYAVVGSRGQDYGRVYENMVAIDLLRKGYEVFVGARRNNEIDFVAQSRETKLYIQVASRIDDMETRERELRPLREIPDAYPRILLAVTQQATYQEDGVQVINLADWLASEGSGRELFEGR